MRADLNKDEELRDADETKRLPPEVDVAQASKDKSKEKLLTLLTPYTFLRWLLATESWTILNTKL